jgi:glycosyltransferase involved in cell wall biosynthesis
VAGAPEATADLEALECARAASAHPDRIIIIPQFIDEDQKVKLVNGSLACVYSPIDEDSYGYVTLEGAQAGKALITTSDSGGILKLVIDGRSGVVCNPDPIEMGAAFDQLFRSRQTATQLGQGAHERMLELGISWDHVLRRLLA